MTSLKLAVPPLLARRTYRPNALRALLALFLGALLLGLLPGHGARAATDGGWTGAGMLQAARMSHTTTLLADGTVLAVGGMVADQPIASAERYDPATGNWNQVGSLGTARRSHTATALANGKLLVTGGLNGGALASAELFDPATGTWSPAAAMGAPRWLHVAVLLADHRVLVIGGVGLKAAEIYSPATNTWAYAGSMESIRFDHDAVRLGNGMVLVSGGSDGGGATAAVATAELYDPATNDWLATGAMGQARKHHSMTALSGGKVLVAGGKAGGNSLATAEIYDTATGTWSPTGALSAPRSYHTATWLSNGLVLVSGGLTTGNKPVATAEIYDQGTGLWSATGSLAGTRSWHAAARVGEKVLVTGGYGSSNGVAGELTAAELFDPAAAPPLLLHALTLTTNGTVALTPPGDVYPAGTTVQLSFSLDPSHVFLGWTVDSVFRGWGTPLTIAMNGPHTVSALFASAPSFSDVPNDPAVSWPIAQLTARGIIQGYGDGRFGPDDTTQRAQMAALTARAMGWDQEDHGNPFVDSSGIDPNLWRNVGTLAHYDVAKGYDPTHFGPTNTVTQAQTISFITRAMIAKGYWVAQPGAPQPYAGVPDDHDLDLRTFAHYTGGVPAPPADWNGEATRAWFARALWAALDSYFGVPVSIQ